VAVKSLMRAVGLPAGPLRKPLAPYAGADLQRGFDIASRLGLDRVYGYKLKPHTSVAA